MGGLVDGGGEGGFEDAGALLSVSETEEERRMLVPPRRVGEDADK